MPTEPTWEETTAVEEPTWDNTTAEQETASPGFLGPAWPAQEGEAIAEPDPERERKRQELANQMRLARAERGLSDVIESFLGGAARAVEPLTPAGLMNQPTRIAGAIAGKTIPDVYQAGQPLVNVPQPTGTGFLAGLGQLGAQTLSGLTTPEMVVTAPAFPVSGVARALTAGEMAATLPESISRGGEVLRAPEATVAEKVVAAGQPLVTAAMVKALTKAERILPQAAEAVRETKGTEYATEKRNIQESVSGERAGDDTLRTPTEAGGGGGVQPAAPIAEAQAVTPPRTAPRQGGVLLDPIVAAAFRTPDGKIFDARTEGGVTHMEADMAARAAGEKVTEKDAGFITQSGKFLTREEAYAHAEKTKQIITELDTFDKGKLHTGKMPSYEELTPEQKLAEQAALDEALGQEPAKPTPQAEPTPTAVPPAEPSIPTPAQGSQLEPISKTTTPEQGTQALVTPEPFLGKTKAEWTPEYYKSLSPENRRAARAQVIGALATEGGKTKVTQESKPPQVLKAIHELLDLREKKKAVTPTEPPPTMAVEASKQSVPTELPALRKADIADDPRLEMPGITKQSKPNSLIVALRDLDSVPVKEIVLKSSGDPLTDANTVESTIKKYAGQGRISLRESLAVTTGPNGRAILKFGISPRGMTWSSAKEWVDLIESRKAKQSETPPTLIPPEPPTIALQAGLGIPGIEKLDRKFDEMRKGLATLMRAGPQRRQMDQTFDATDNMANIVARQVTNQLRLNGNPIELEAIYPFIEAKGDINRLAQFIAQATGKNDTAVAAAQYAQAHWNDPHFQALATRAKAISDAQIRQEQAAGINTEYREAYLPHSYDRDLMMGFNRPFVIGGGGSGMRTGFKKGRTFETIYDAIEAGYPVKTLNAADTLESRIRSGQKLINRVEWADSFRHVTDPTDGQPIVTSLERHARQKGKPGWESPPAGYARRTIIPGVDVAIHEGYTSLFDAITGTSRIAGSVPGKLVLEAEGALKHGLLLFDTYHVSRILQKEAALVGPTKMGWRKGLTLLEYSDADLNAALREGFITPEMANFARANRADAELLIRSGLNVGRIQENLYNSVVRQIPVIGKFNKWVFEKMTRGAMLQSGLIELERVQRDFGLTRQEAAMKVSRDLNAYFGNLGRQGIFKSSTAQDVARIVALAPQWVESMLRTEIGSVGKAVIDPIKYRKLAVSSLPLGVGAGLAAYFVATQILNMVTRGHPTWQNPEKGHKLDAWIPDFTGKTGGYFLSPFSVPAEVTHDMIRYARTEPDTIAAASRILSNKQSPLYRATKTLLTGKDWTGEKLIGSWERAKAASINLVPAPIGAAPLIMGEKYPGQTQRQITASLGIKTEPAPTAVQQIRELKKNWGLNNPNPKIQHQFEQALKAEYGKSDYDDLRRALSAGDMKKAGEEYDALVAMGKKRADINDAVSWYTGGKETANGVYQERKIKPIAGQISESAEAKFKASLTPTERKIYAQAIEERKRIYARFLELLKTR